jgi:hypothetical protein
MSEKLRQRVMNFLIKLKEGDKIIKFKCVLSRDGLVTEEIKRSEVYCLPSASRLR